MNIILVAALVHIQTKLGAKKFVTELVIGNNLYLRPVYSINGEIDR